MRERNEPLWISQGLSEACERALVAGARTQRAGTRQQLRAAARRFVRRHRRDVGYLRWVLRSVVASSALAVALLGLGAEPAHAKATLFAPQTGFANPLDGQDAGSFSTPALGDLDGDRDLDLVAGTRAGAFRYFENTGTAWVAVFIPRTGAANPLAGADAGGTFSTPALGDLDADGDLDLVAGELSGSFAWFENTGSATSPAFVPRTGFANPLDGQIVQGAATPALGDLDSDGDLDLVAGEASGTFAYFENTGSATSPAFILRTGLANPLHGENVGYYAAPVLGDLDGDGDLDLVAGVYYGAVAYFENTGSAVHKAFMPRTGRANPLDGLSVGNGAAPSLGDLDGDGDLDLALGEDSGSFLSFENLAGDVVARTGAANPLRTLDVGDKSAAALGDLDGDGDLDLVAGEYFATFRYFENTGSAASPAFIPRTGTANPLDGQDVGFLSRPALGDLDGDGDLDLVAGERDGSFFYFENTGSATSPSFAPRTGAANPLNGEDVELGSAPSLGDLDGDGDLDLVAGENSGTFLYFENTGGATSPSFAPRTGAANPLNGEDVGLGSGPSLGDLDGDGDLDLVAGRSSPGFFYFENTGGATNPAFVPRTGASNPLDGQDVAITTMPAIGDLDGDGDLDVVSGEYYGKFPFLENAIVKPALSAFELTGAANPLAGQDIGYQPKPALGDLDGDGDFDAVAGEIYGTFAYFENTGSAISPAYIRHTGAENPLDGQDVGSDAAPALGDLDADGDLDLISGRDDGAFIWFENTGSATSPVFVLRTGAADPLDGQDAGFNSTSTLGDLDGDGDLDLASGEFYGTVLYFQNTGSATSPAFVQLTGGGNPLDGHDVGSRSVPVLGDLDGDGDLDLVAGGGDGVFTYFENTGHVRVPIFVPRTGAANPLDGQDVGGGAKPSLADLDADGDLDLVSGEDFGTFHTYYLPEPGQGILLGTGLALLSLLDRLRGRRER